MDQISYVFLFCLYICYYCFHENTCKHQADFWSYKFNRCTFQIIIQSARSLLSLVEIGNNNSNATTQLQHNIKHSVLLSYSISWMYTMGVNFSIFVCRSMPRVSCRALVLNADANTAFHSVYIWSAVLSHLCAIFASRTRMFMLLAPIDHGRRTFFSLLNNSFFMHCYDCYPINQ